MTLRWTVVGVNFQYTTKYSLRYFCICEDPKCNKNHSPHTTKFYRTVMMDEEEYTTMQWAIRPARIAMPFTPGRRWEKFVPLNERWARNELTLEAESFVPWYQRTLEALSFITSRSFVPRKSLLNLDKTAFNFLFDGIAKHNQLIAEHDHYEFINFSTKSITKPLFGQPSYDAGSFPSNISHWIWGGEIEIIKNDSSPVEASWYLFCLLDNGLFAFYCAHFQYRAKMSLYLSDDPSILINYAMTDAVYRLYESETTPAPCWDPWDDVAARRLVWMMVGREILGDAGSDLLPVIGNMVGVE
jgi:hypothetical protein